MLFTSRLWDGGIMTGTDAVEFMMAGADTVQVGTASLASPMQFQRSLMNYVCGVKK